MSSLPRLGMIHAVRKGALGRVLALLLALSAGLAGCAIAPADQEATRRAWAERDAERARECRQARGGFIAGGCVFGGGS